MLDEIKKSISATLYERTTSPLFGTFFFTWVIWNWKIIMVLFFTTSIELKTTKFEYINDNLLNILNGLIYPIISTIVILTLYAWLSEQAYRLWLFFDKRKSDYKNEIEKHKLLSVEQSMKLRIEIANKEESFENIIKDKEQLISALKSEIKELATRLKTLNDLNAEKNSILENSNDGINERDQFFENAEAASYFEHIANYVQHNWIFESKQIPDRITSYYIAHDLISKGNHAGTYDFTEKGKIYLREYFRRKT